MKICYIAGSFRAPTQYGIHLNVIAAEARALDWWKRGYACICPHLNTANFQGELPDETWLKGCLEIMKRCDVVVVLKGWQNSSGTQEEIKVAMEKGLEIIYE